MLRRKTTTITLDTSSGLEVGNRLRRADGGPVLVVTHVGSNCVTVRPCRWWETKWARWTGLAACVGALGAWMAWLLSGVL